MRFRIIDESTGTPVQQLTLTFGPLEARLFHAAPVKLMDIDGVFEAQEQNSEEGIMAVSLLRDGLPGRRWLLDRGVAGAEQVHDFVLPACRTIGGKVIDRDGLAISGAEVGLIFGPNQTSAAKASGSVMLLGNPITVRTDFQGCWVYEHCPSDAMVCFLLVAVGEDAPMTVSLQNPSLSSDAFARLLERKLVTTYQEPLLIEGRVVNQKDELVPEVSVSTFPPENRRASCSRGIFRISYREDSHDLGPFSRSGHHSGGISIQFQAEGFLNQRLSVPPGRSMLGLVVRMRPATIRFGGFILGDGGRPQKGALVRIQPTQELMAQSTIPPAATTDEAGRFVFWLDTRTPITVVVESSSHLKQSVQLQPNRELRIQLERCFQVKVLVLDDLTGQPIAGAAVGVRSGYLHSGPASLHVESTGEDGTADVRLHSNDPFWLMAQSARYSDACTELFETVVEGAAITIRMEPLRTIRGRLLSCSGEPVPRAILTLVPEINHPSRHDFGNYQLRHPIRTTTDPRGFFELKGVDRPPEYPQLLPPPGFPARAFPGHFMNHQQQQPRATRWIQVDHDGLVLSWELDELISSGELRLPPVGAVEGTVTGLAAGIQWAATLHPAEPPGMAHSIGSHHLSVVDANGTFSMPKYPVGVYRLVFIAVDRPGLGPTVGHQELVEVKPGEVTRVRVGERARPRNQVQISGRIVVHPDLPQKSWVEVFEHCFGFLPSFALTLLDESSGQFQVMANPVRVRPGPDGTFEADLPSRGKYLFHFCEPEVDGIEAVQSMNETPFLQGEPLFLEVGGSTPASGSPSQFQIHLRRAAWKGLRAPAFKLHRVGGGLLSLADLKGRAVILKVVGCDQGMENLEVDLPRLLDAFGSDPRVAVVLVWVRVPGHGGPPELPFALATRLEAVVTCTIFGRPEAVRMEDPLDCDSDTLMGAFGMHCFPTTWLIDGDGICRGQVDDYHLPAVVRQHSPFR